MRCRARSTALTSKLVSNGAGPRSRDSPNSCPTPTLGASRNVSAWYPRVAGLASALPRYLRPYESKCVGMVAIGIDRGLVICRRVVHPLVELLPDAALTGPGWRCSSNVTRSIRPATNRVAVGHRRRPDDSYP